MEEGGVPEENSESSLRSAPFSLPCTSGLGQLPSREGVAASHLGTHLPLISTGLSCYLLERFSFPSRGLFSPITSTPRHILSPFVLVMNPSDTVRELN